MNCLRSSAKRCLWPGQNGVKQRTWLAPLSISCDVCTCDNSTIRMPVTSAQLRMARAALNWTVRELAEATGLHRNTITNIEVGRYTGEQKSLERIELVLKKAGVQFIDENGGGPGVRLRKQQRKKG